MQAADFSDHVLMLAAFHQIPRIAAKQRERDLPAQVVPEPFQLEGCIDLASRPEQGDNLPVDPNRSGGLARGQDGRPELGAEGRRVDPAGAGQPGRHLGGIEVDQGPVAAGRPNIHAARGQPGLESRAAARGGHDDRRASLGDRPGEVVSCGLGQLFVTVVELGHMAMQAQGGRARFARHEYL